VNEHPRWVLILMVPKRALFNARLGVNLVQTRLQSLCVETFVNVHVFRITTAFGKFSANWVLVNFVFFILSGTWSEDGSPKAGDEELEPCQFLVLFVDSKEYNKSRDSS
jgi:hypothetical protein